MSKVSKHFVKFYSPGSFMAETTEKPIDSWDVKKAVAMAKSIKERYAAVPYGFQFSTRERGDEDLDSKVTKKSCFYYLPHCKVETLAEIKKRNNPKESILRSNMECNGYDRIVTTTEGWKWSQMLDKNDVVLT